MGIKDKSKTNYIQQSIKARKSLATLVVETIRRKGRNGDNTTWRGARS